MGNRRATHIAEARRHVIEGEQRVARQEALVEQLRRNGHDITEARKLLAILRDTLTLMRRHLQMMLEE